jgi:hypothetical protein
MADNVLDAEPLSVEAVAKMLELSKPIDLWITYFLSLANTTPGEYVSAHERETPGSASTGSDWEEGGIGPSLEDFERARANLQTPKRLKVGPLLASLMDINPVGGVGLEILVEVDAHPEYATQAERGDLARDSLMTIVQEWGKVKKHFKLLNSEFATQGASEMRFRNVLATTISSLQAVVHESDSKIQLLVSRIGESQEASDGGPLTCRDALKQLQEGMDAIKDCLLITDQLVEQLRQAGAGTEVRLENLGKSFANMTAHYRTAVTNINDQLGRLSRRLPEISAGFGGARYRQFGVAPGDVGADVIALRQRVKELEDGVRWSGRTTNRHETAAFEALTRDVRDLEALAMVAGNSGVDAGATEHLERTMDVLRAKIKEMEGLVTYSSFRLNQYTFSTFYEVKTWCEETKVETYGILWDLFIVLVAMKPKYQTGEDAANERYSLARIKSTPFENDLSAAMSHPRPLALFGKRGGELAPVNEGFGACPTYYEQWVGSGCESVKALLPMQLVNFCAEVTGTLDLEHPATPFVTALLTEVQAQWNHMVSCIETFHNDLLYVAKFTKPKAWQLLRRTMAAVFEAMSGPRAEVARLSDNQDLHSKAGLIWGVLRCHRIMQQFIVVKFRGHPAIVKEMTLFMLTERVYPS